MLHNFGRGAAAVNIKKVSADLLSHLRGHPHAFRLTAKNLHGKGSLVCIKTHLPFGFWVTARQALNGNKLRYSQSYTATAFN